MARIHGSKGQILIDPTGADPGTPVVIASMNSWSLEMNRDRVDVTASTTGALGA